jgi:hypothetical protein
MARTSGQTIYDGIYFAPLCRPNTVLAQQIDNSKFSFLSATLNSNNDSAPFQINAPRIIPQKLEVVTAPNPVNSDLSIHCFIPLDGFASVKLFDMRGMLVATVAEGVFTTDIHTLHFDANSLASGQYICVLQTFNSSVRKLVTVIH